MPTLPAEAQIVKDLPDPKPLFVTRQGFEKLFGMRVQTLANLAGQGKGVRYYRRGKLCFYRVADIEAWLTKYPVETTQND